MWLEMDKDVAAAIARVELSLGKVELYVSQVQGCLDAYRAAYENTWKPLYGMELDKPVPDGCAGSVAYMLGCVHAAHKKHDHAVRRMEAAAATADRLAVARYGLTVRGLRLADRTVPGDN